MQNAPLIVVPSSGGARMQEGILSLMQMARTSLAFEEVIKNNLSGKKDINHHCLRVGNVVGDHMIKYTLENESIEINHKSFDRKIFAEGAIFAVKWISSKKDGLYDMGDALSL